MNDCTTRRQALALLAGAALLPAARAQPGTDPYPSHPITMWVPWPAGGATDITLRILAELAGRQLGQKMLVDNRSGAGGTLAMPLLQHAAPDGYTIGQVPYPVFRTVHTQKVAWDPLRDLTPIIQVSGVTFGIVVPAASPFKSLDDLFDFAKRKPGELSVSTNGAGTTPHVVMDELFSRRSLSYIHVPYKGTAEQMIAVASGQVMAGVNSNGFAPFVDTGQLRLLVTFGDKRTRRWPTVPTLKELGHNIVATSPYGLCGPHGMPPAIVKTLHDALRAAMFDPSHVTELAKYDQDLAYLGPEDYGRSMREIYAAERATVERMGMLRPPG